MRFPSVVCIVHFNNDMVIKVLYKGIAIVLLYLNSLTILGIMKYTLNICNGLFSTICLIDVSPDVIKLNKCVPFCIY